MGLGVNDPFLGVLLTHQMGIYKKKFHVCQAALPNPIFFIFGPSPPPFSFPNSQDKGRWELEAEPRTWNLKPETRNLKPDTWDLRRGWGDLNLGMRALYKVGLSFELFAGIIARVA